MKHISYLLALLSINVNAQIIRGKIVDYENNSGIEYAHIINPANFNGAISDSNGFFEINLGYNLNTLIISCVGYRDTVVIAEESKEITIRLKKEYIQLDEITVYGERTENRYLGVYRRRPNEVSLIKGNHKTDFGFTVYFPYDKSGIVKSFGIHIFKISGTDIKLRLRFLEPDTTFQTIGFDKLVNEVVIDTPGTGWNVIKLDDENIKISENGLIVRFYFTGIEANDNLTISGSSKTNDYNWVSSLDYTRDFPLTIRNRKIKPAVNLLIME